MGPDKMQKMYSVIKAVIKSMNGFWPFFPFGESLHFKLKFTTAVPEFSYSLM
jgi:hypothetical protein